MITSTYCQPRRENPASFKRIVFIREKKDPRQRKSLMIENLSPIFHSNNQKLIGAFKAMLIFHLLVYTKWHKIFRLSDIKSCFMYSLCAFQRTLEQPQHSASTDHILPLLKSIANQLYYSTKSKDLDHIWMFMQFVFCFKQAYGV